jgi:tRNA(Ile)-lysidine synthase
LLVDCSVLLLKLGCRGIVNWIQIKTKLLRSFAPDDRYLVGVSGGRDSVVLLHWLISLGYKNLVVCHLNHQLRGRSSDADARFVENLVHSYNKSFEGQPRRVPGQPTGKRSTRPTTAAAHLVFESGTANVRALAKRKRTSIETAAREARYEFFARTARSRNCVVLFLAHHADDLVETFLINLFRGAGSAGLSAMRDVSTRRVHNVDLTIVRPLLSVWRSDIDRYVRGNRLKFREDASNKSLNPLRNRIRHKVIPFLEKVPGRNIRVTIWRAAAIAAEEENWIQTQLGESIGAELSVAKLRALPVALQRRTILKWLRAQSISEVGFDTIERVRSLADPDRRIAKVNLPRNRHARRRAGRIFLE